MVRQALSLALALELAGPLPLPTQTGVDAEVARGIKQVEDGDLDIAIITLDAAARRLSGDPARARDLGQAYLYLGIAYLGKGHEALAKAKFREAVQQTRELSLSPDQFPARVLELLEAARQEVAKKGCPLSVCTRAEPGAKAQRRVETAADLARRSSRRRHRYRGGRRRRRVLVRRTEHIIQLPA